MVVGQLGNEMIKTEEKTPTAVGQLGNETIKNVEQICIDILNDILITLTRKDVVSQSELPVLFLN